MPLTALSPTPDTLPTRFSMLFSSWTQFDQQGGRMDALEARTGSMLI